VQQLKETVARFVPWLTVDTLEKKLNKHATGKKHASNFNEENVHVIVTTYQSLEPKQGKTIQTENYRDVPWGKVAAVFLDEAHNALSENRAGMVRVIREKKLPIFAFTATPAIKRTEKQKALCHLETCYELLDLTAENNPIESFPLTRSIDLELIAPVVTQLVKISEPIMATIEREKQAAIAQAQNADEISDNLAREIVNNPALNTLAVDLYANGVAPHSEQPFRGMQGICFCANVQHAHDMAQAFNDKLSIDAVDPNDELRQRYVKNVREKFITETIKRPRHQRNLSLSMPTNHLTTSELGELSQLEKEARENFCVAAYVHAPKSGKNNRTTSKDSQKMDSRQILKDFKLGRYLVLMGVEMLVEGFDCPPITWVYIARLTKSPKLKAQCVGRGLRLDPNNPTKICYVFELFFPAIPKIQYSFLLLQDQDAPDEVMTFSRGGEKLEHYLRKTKEKIECQKRQNPNFHQKISVGEIAYTLQTEPDATTEIIITQISKAKFTSASTQASTASQSHLKPTVHQALIKIKEIIQFLQKQIKLLEDKDINVTLMKKTAGSAEPAFVNGTGMLATESTLQHFLDKKVQTKSATTPQKASSLINQIKAILRTLRNDLIADEISVEHEEPATKSTVSFKHFGPMTLNGLLKKAKELAQLIPRIWIQHASDTSEHDTAILAAIQQKTQAMETHISLLEQETQPATEDPPREPTPEPNTSVLPHTVDDIFSDPMQAAAGAMDCTPGDVIENSGITTPQQESSLEQTSSFADDDSDMKDAEDIPTTATDLLPMETANHSNLFLGFAPIIKKFFSPENSRARNRAPRWINLKTHLSHQAEKFIALNSEEKKELIIALDEKTFLSLMRRIHGYDDNVLTKFQETISCWTHLCLVLDVHKCMHLQLPSNEPHFIHLYCSTYFPQMLKHSEPASLPVLLRCLQGNFFRGGFLNAMLTQNIHGESFLNLLFSDPASLCTYYIPKITSLFFEEKNIATAIINSKNETLFQAIAKKLPLTLADPVYSKTWIKMIQSVNEGEKATTEKYLSKLYGTWGLRTKKFWLPDNKLSKKSPVFILYKGICDKWVTRAALSSSIARISLEWMKSRLEKDYPMCQQPTLEPAALPPIPLASATSSASMSLIEEPPEPMDFPKSNDLPLLELTDAETNSIYGSPLLELTDAETNSIYGSSQEKTFGAAEIAGSTPLFFAPTPTPCDTPVDQLGFVPGSPGINGI